MNSYQRFRGHRARFIRFAIADVHVGGSKGFYMIAYTMVGTSDLDRACLFYEPIFAEMGYESCYRDAQVASWGSKSKETVPRFSTGYPFNGQPSGLGNGAMTAFLVSKPNQIDRLFEIAVRQGGSIEGEPGPRPQYGDGFYAAYVRDPDGNKIAFVSYGSS